VGKLGATLAPEDAAAIMLKPMRPFAAGELCAARDPGMAPNAAAAAAERRANGNGSAGTSRLCPPTSLDRIPHGCLYPLLLGKRGVAHRR